MGSSKRAWLQDLASGSKPGIKYWTVYVFCVTPGKLKMDNVPVFKRQK